MEFATYILIHKINKQINSQINQKNKELKGNPFSTHLIIEIKLLRQIKKLTGKEFKKIVLKSVITRQHNEQSHF